MYFYNSFLLISSILIFAIYTESQQPKGPGNSGCTFLSFANEECGTMDVKISDIPNECSSIIMYDGIFVNLSYNIFADPYSSVRNTKILDHLDEILKSGKSTYIYYGYATELEWSQMLTDEASNGGNKSLEEMKSLKVFLDEHKGITGLILMNLEYDCNSENFPKYSENLKKYLEVMKKTSPELEIGIELKGDFLIYQITNHPLPWLDFEVIDASVDFYIISLYNLNNCKEELIYTGITPISSSNTIYSLEKVKSVLLQACIPKEKTYFGFALNPISSDPNDSYTRCNLTIQTICLDKERTSGWCSDNLTSFNENGQFAEKNGVGFITTNIDLNDPTNLCKCEKPFASFYALLDGFNGRTTKPCALFSRT